MTSGSAVETLHLRKQFGATTALEDFTITIRRGEVFGLLGPNGAGKTTAVKLLLGLARPTSGAASILGAPLGSRAARGRVGYLPELFRYPAWMTPLEIVLFHARLLGTPVATRRTAATTVLERVGLGERTGDRSGSFSKGMQQRLGLAVALTGSPELVILDEPTSALDPIGRHDVRRIIEDLRASGTAMLLNSHLLTEVERVCDTIAFVERGRVVTSGSIPSMLGASSALRVRLGAPSPAVEGALRARGPLSFEQGWFSIAGVNEADVPATIAELVSLGASVYGVDLVRATLEERFIQLMSHDAPTEDVARARDRLTHPA